MAALTDSFDLGSLSMSPGEGRRLSLEVGLDDVEFSDQTYAVVPARAPVTVDVSQMTGGGWSLRLRFEAALEGPCMRCLTAARPAYSVDAREIDQENGGEELDSPYIEGDELDLRGWARDALALELPAQILCKPDCAGLCPQCGLDLNENPGHEHEREPDPRWAALKDLEFE